MEFSWKGISSVAMQGVVVTSLPPITVPPMRVKETTIDGRDGSILEELGYQAYDKEVGIGLMPNSHIDTIIQWLTGKGRLILGNEPDKYYNAQVISQIDYERLLRFKTASVKFRVQPFKYKIGETSETIITSGNITNQGNRASKPIITMTGSGTVEVSLGGVAQFSYTFPEGETSVTIDSDKEDAYVGSTLKNRNMTGEFIELAVGLNAISYTGTVTSFVIEPKSRWV